MKMSSILLAFAQVTACVFAAQPSYAFDLTGAWATDAGVCGKIFVKQGQTIAFRPHSSEYGSGFVVGGDHIRGQSAQCRIKATKQDGAITHLLASCATDILLSNAQFSFKVVNDNRIIRLYPGMEDEQIMYDRCPM